MRVVSFEEAMGQIDDEIILEVASTLNSENENRSVGYKNRKRMGRTLLIAAVIAVLITAAALAIGYSIHQKRQAELRQALQIDLSNVTSYIEYETAQTDHGVTILSAISDGKFQKLYVNISPVEKEDTEALGEKIPFSWSVDGENWGGIVEPVENAYDEQSKTLTVECSILMKKLEGMDSAELRIARIDMDALENSGSKDIENWVEENNALLGTARFTPTKQEMRFINFTPVTFTDEDTGRKVTVLALELSPTGAMWHLCYDGAEKLYDSSKKGEALDVTSMELLRAEEYVLNHAVLHFSDGTTFAPGGALSGTYADGVVLLYSAWEKAVNINALESVTVGDAELPILQK